MSPVPFPLYNKALLALLAPTRRAQSQPALDGEMDGEQESRLAPSALDPTHVACSFDVYK